MKAKNNTCDMCEKYVFDELIVDFLKSKQLNSDIVLQLAELFKTMADVTRIKIINALREKDLCVCELAELLAMTPSAISHQLRVLRAANLVKFKKEGRSAIYSLADEHVLCLFAQGLEHVLEEKGIK